MLLGLDANRICKWDMRTPGGVATYDSPLPYVGGKDYARGTNFTCMATSGDGWVVVGSRDGKLRLYNGTSLTQAKTSIPGLGKPITNVDVTYDGRYVLATTDDYLLLVKTTWMEGGEAAEGHGGLTCCSLGGACMWLASCLHGFQG
jgi:WD40 repeat protein